MFINFGFLSLGMAKELSLSELEDLEARGREFEDAGVDL